MNPAMRSPFSTAWVAEAVQLIEQEGPLDDSQVLLRAQRSHAAPNEQLGERAWLLGDRLGLLAQLARWREAGWLLLVLAAGAVLAVANGLLFAVLTDGRSINAASALVSALGLHIVTLLFWLGSVMLARSGSHSAGFSLSLGRLLASVALRLPFWRGPRAAPLMRAGLRLLARERLAPWAFGLVSHGIWTLGFVFLLGGLLFAFAFREFQLTWETTILGPDWFAAFARVTGALPAWLGVPIPTLADSAQTAGAWPAREAAWWLLSCVALYGLLPRALCALWCWWVVRRAVRRMALPVADPYYQQLLARLRALEPAQVTDAEASDGMAPHVPWHHSGTFGSASAVVGFELPASVPWPPHTLADGAAFVARIAGSMAEQAQVHARLAQLRPKTLVVVCAAQASPDRGTARFLREAALSAQHCALALHLDAADEADEAESNAADLLRWHAWVQASGLEVWSVFDSVADAARWMEAQA